MDWTDEFRGRKVVITDAAGIYGGWFAAAFARRDAALRSSRPGNSIGTYQPAAANH